MILIDKFLEINNKWKRKYNRLCVQYETLATKEIDKLERANDILLTNIEYRDLIEKQKEELKTYRRKFGRLEGGDKSVKYKNKGQR